MLVFRIYKVVLKNLALIILDYSPTVRGALSVFTRKMDEFGTERVACNLSTTGEENVKILHRSGSK